MDAKKILKKLRGEHDRASHSIYVSKTVMQEFVEACGKEVPSRVLELMMMDFVDDMKPRARASYLKKAASKKN